MYARPWPRTSPPGRTNRSSGLINRVPDPANRTRVLVRLTDAGYALYLQAIREANLVEADLLTALSPAQKVQLAELLEEVIACVDSAELAGSEDRR